MKKSVAIKPLKTRRGSTSFFIAGFMILILAVFMLGFSRLMISEFKQTSNNDLSQSAYDSALAGIEDAKVALLKYHQCLDDGATRNSGSSECQIVIRAMADGMDKQDCDIVQKALNRKADANSEGATVIQETQRNVDGGVAKDMQQAYTCITIQEDLQDYRTQLNSASRTRLVPIRTDRLNDIDHIKISWSPTTATTSSNYTYDADKTLYPRQASFNTIDNPPLLGVSLFQADREFSLAELSTARADGQTNRATVYLKPVSTGAISGNVVTTTELSKSADKNRNEILGIKCAKNAAEANSPANGGYYCNATIKIPKTFNGNNTRNNGASFLLLSLPYGTPEIDVAVELKDASGNSIQFDNVQANVDVTGRANTLYRRLEARIELIDILFPYPEFTIELHDDGTNETRKTFRVTNNCWHSYLDGNRQLQVTTCSDYGEDEDFASPDGVWVNLTPDNDGDDTSASASDAPEEDDTDDSEDDGEDEAYYEEDEDEEEDAEVEW